MCWWFAMGLHAFELCMAVLKLFMPEILKLLFWAVVQLPGLLGNSFYWYHFFFILKKKIVMLTSAAFLDGAHITPVISTDI